MSKPRVIFINRVYWPSLAATSQLLTDLAEGLASRGWPVHVVATGREPGPHHGVVVHRTGEGDQHGGLVSRAGNYLRFIDRVRTKLKVLAEPEDRVVIMTDPPLLGAAVTSLATSRGARVIHWVQDIYPEIAAAHFGGLAAPFLWPLRSRRDASWRRAAGCVVLGKSMAGEVARHRVIPTQITTIPNWAPRELKNPASARDRDRQRQAWGLGDHFIVAYSGNLGRVHEVEAILTAAEILRDRPHLIFLFLGGGARLAEVRAAMTERRLPNIRLLPTAPRENLASSLAAADVQLVTLGADFASLVFPSKLAGVLAAGRPTVFVGPRDGEIASLLETEGCGATVSPSDGAGLAEKIERWRSNPVEGARLGQQARIAYEKHFTFDAALSRWEEVLT